MSNIEDELIERFDDAQTNEGIDDGALWASIENELDTTKVGAGVYWKAGVLLLLIGVAVTGMWVTMPDDSALTNIKLPPRETEALTTDAPIANQAKANDSEKSAEVTASSTTSESVTAEPIVHAQSISNEASGPATNRSEGGSHSSGASNYTQSGQSNSVSGGGVSSSVGNFGSTDKSGSPKRTLPFDPTSGDSGDEAAARSGGVEGEKSFAGREGNKTGNPLTEDSSNSNSNEGRTFGVEKEKDMEFMAMLGLPNAFELPDELNQSDMRDIRSDKKTTALPVELIMQFNAGISQFDQAVDFTTDREGISWTNKDQVSWSAGMRANWQVARNWYLGAGIGYEKIQSQFNYNAQADTALVMLQDHIIGLTQDTAGIDMPVFGSHWQSGRYSREVIHHNDYEFMIVPMSVGYQMHISKRSKFRLEAGIMVGILLKQNGRTINEEQDAIDFFGKEGLMPASTIRYHFSPVYQKALNDRLSLRVAPSVSLIPDSKSGLSSTTVGIMDYRLGIGVTYHLK